MCQQHQLAAAANNANNNMHQQQSSSKLKPSYSIKRVLQTLFRNSNKQQHHHQRQQHQQQKSKQQHRQQHRLQQQRQRLCNSLESLESLENLRNAQMEEQHFYEEIEDNSANEKLAELVQEAANEEEENDIYVPVRFARTTAGTFFWTTNLQPVLSSFAPVAADEDLLQPSYCYSNAQYPHMQYPTYQPDRWAQA